MEFAFTFVEATCFRTLFIISVKYDKGSKVFLENFLYRAWFFRFIPPVDFMGCFW